MQLTKVRLLILSLSALLLVMSFQNCGDVRVETPVQIASKTSLLRGEFCAGEPGGDPVQLQNFFFINLTAKAVGKHLLPDSDIDGVADETEVANVALGFLKDSPYSSGILDGICAQQGGQGCVPTVCDPAVLSLGLLQCDAIAISSTSTLTGADTDLDGVPDFIEVLKGLDPLRAILDEDTDLQADGSFSNIDELQQGLDPTSIENLDVSLRTYWTAPKQADRGLCGNQDRYAFMVNSFPLVDVEASDNPYFAELSHARNENVMIAIFVSYPLDRTKSGKIFYQILKVNKDSGPPELLMDPAEFKLLGSFALP